MKNTWKRIIAVFLTVTFILTTALPSYAQEIDTVDNELYEEYEYDLESDPINEELTETQAFEISNADMVLSEEASEKENFNKVHIKASADEIADTEFRIYFWEYDGAVPDDANDWKSYFNIPFSGLIINNENNGIIQIPVIDNELSYVNAELIKTFNNSGVLQSIYLSFTIPAGSKIDTEILIGSDANDQSYLMLEAKADGETSDYLPVVIEPHISNQTETEMAADNDSTNNLESDAAQIQTETEEDILVLLSELETDEEFEMETATDKETDFDDEFVLEDDEEFEETKNDDEFPIRMLASGYDLTDDAQAIYNQLENEWPSNLSEKRKELIKTALSAIGHVTYTLDSVDYTDPIQSEMGCSRFLSWVYYQSGFEDFGSTSANNVINRADCMLIPEKALLPGDIGSLQREGAHGHCGIYLGTIGGVEYWCHSSTSDNIDGVRASTYTGFTTFSRYNELAEYDPDLYIDVTDYGANGNDAEDDTLSIQEALDTAYENDNVVTVFVPAGTYYISDSLLASSGTNLILDDDATIIRMSPSFTMLSTRICDSSDGSGYGRASNISVSGGTWDGQCTDRSADQLFQISHCQDITIENVTLQNWANYHAISLHGCNNVTVRDCTFSDFKPSEGLSDINGEALHIDAVTVNNGLTPFDSTPSSNIVVENCSFVNCHCGIGNHRTSVESSNVTIKNNTFQNITGTCINLAYFTNAEISGNVAETAHMFCYVYGKSSNITISDNDADCNYGTGLPSNANAIYVTDSEASICNNTIKKASASAVYALNNSDVIVDNNVIEDSTSHAIYVSGAHVDSANNVISSSVKENILYSNATGNINGNTITGGDSHGIQVYQCQNGVNVENNNVKDSGECGIILNQSIADAVGNTVTGATTYGIQIYKSAGNCIVKNNDVSASEKYGIYVNTSDGTVAGNTANNNVSYGLKVSGSTVDISDNTIQDNGAYADVDIVDSDTVTTTGIFSEPKDSVSRVWINSKNVKYVPTAEVIHAVVGEKSAAGGYVPEKAGIYAVTNENKSYKVYATYALSDEAEATYKKLEAEWPDHVSEERKMLVRTALSGIGNITYNTNGGGGERCSAADADCLHCSQFVSWSYYQTGMPEFGWTLAKDVKNRDDVTNISHDDLLPGDIGSCENSAGEGHTGIYVGTIDGEDVWCHSAGTGVTAGSYGHFNTYSRYNELAKYDYSSSEHNYKETSKTNATCTKDGKVTYTCSICGDTYTETLKATGHSYSSKITTTASCTKNGVRTYTCSHCGDKYTETIPATGHTEVKDKAVSATCTKTGLTEGSHCSVCGTVIIKQETTKALGHDYKWVTDKDADYGIKGSRHQECTRCGAKGKTEEIKAKTVGRLYPKVTGVTKSKQKISWNSIKGATKYVVYGAKCGDKSYSKLKTVKDGSTTYTNKKLKSGTYYKYYVVAYNGSTQIQKSYVVHATTKGGQYWNPATPTVTKSSINVKVGNTKQIKATWKASKPVKNHWNTKLKYYSSNSSIATVSSTGMVTGKKSGTCKIYVVAQNGKKCSVSVTVK